MSQVFVWESFRIQRSFWPAWPLCTSCPNKVDYIAWCHPGMWWVMTYFQKIEGGKVCPWNKPACTCTNLIEDIICVSIKVRWSRKRVTSNRKTVFRPISTFLLGILFASLNSPVHQTSNVGYHELNLKRCYSMCNCFLIIITLLQFLLFAFIRGNVVPILPKVIGRLNYSKSCNSKDVDGRGFAPTVNKCARCMFYLIWNYSKRQSSKSMLLVKLVKLVELVSLAVSRYRGHWWSSQPKPVELSPKQHQVKLKLQLNVWVLPE